VEIRVGIWAGPGDKEQRPIGRGAIREDWPIRLTGRKDGMQVGIGGERRRTCLGTKTKLRGPTRASWDRFETAATGHTARTPLTPERDGYPADPESIYLTAGASAGVSQILSIALQKGEGCMIPIPQYPLYTATLAYVEATPLPYYLQESEGWSMNHQVLVDAISEAKQKGTPVKALVIINPGNPTGACLSEKAIKEVIQLCYDERILLLADEVYQTNIFDGENKPFHSFKKVLRSMAPEVANGVELVSFHSISKGVSGECGRRGGYYEVVNVGEDVMEQVYKMASVSLCPPVSGQVRFPASAKRAGRQLTLDRRGPARLAPEAGPAVLRALRKGDEPNAQQPPRSLALHGRQIQQPARHVVPAGRRSDVPFPQDRYPAKGRRRGQEARQGGRCHVRAGPAGYVWPCGRIE